MSPVPRSPHRNIFEVPIYRCSLDEHTKFIDREREQYMAYIGADPVKTPESHASAIRAFEAERWYSWRYNEVVGWVRVYALGSQVRGELWFVSAKRLLPRGQNRFVYQGKAFELHPDLTLSDEAIASEVIDEFRALQRERAFHRRYIDFECLARVAPFVRWRELLARSNWHA